MNEQEILDRAKRAAMSVDELDQPYDALLRRRDRKRRNQRIAAGVVGIAVFVAAVWIVTNGLSLDRSDTSVVPAVSGTTGPAETEPSQTGPVGWDGQGLPPEGTVLSYPVEGHQILEQNSYHTFRIVYGDGRVLWWNDLRSFGANGPGGGDYVLERRLTSEGVDLVRSGVHPSDLPDSAWADPEPRPYAPPRYSVCFEPNDGARPSEWPSGAVELLPAPAKDLLSGADADPLHPGCVVVGTVDARAFYDILTQERLDAASEEDIRDQNRGLVTPGATVGAWLLPDAERILGEQVGIYLHPLWPDGEWHAFGGA
jgi:hypothetical protein